MPKTCGDCVHCKVHVQRSNMRMCGYYDKDNSAPIWAHSVYIHPDSNAEKCAAFSSLARKRAMDEAKQILDELMSVLNIYPKKPKVEL